MELLYDSLDHRSLTHQAIAILAGDGQPEAELLLPPPRGRGLGEPLARGSSAADGMVGIFFHFHHPFSHRGFAGSLISAADMAERKFEQARRLWQQGKKEAALFRLGFTLHLLQDSHVPHHAGLLGAFPLGIDPYGHAAYEELLRQGGRWREFSVSFGGEYVWNGYHFDPEQGDHVTTSERVYDWIDESAAASFRLLPMVNRGENPRYRENITDVAAVLVPRTLRWTAGLIHRFFVSVLTT